MVDDSKVRMNLAAIKKVDPYAKDIVDTSSHVAFYIFNSEQNEWEKTDVEGAFFIYSRNGQPFHSIFIINRINTTSFVEPITQQLELQTQAPFLLYRNEKSRIRGFWFYNSSECERISKVVNDLVQNLPLNNSSRNSNNGSTNNIAATHPSTVVGGGSSGNYPTVDNESVFSKLSAAGDEEISNRRFIMSAEGGGEGDENCNLRHSNMGNVAVKDVNTTSNNSNNNSNNNNNPNVNIFKMLTHAQQEFNNTQNNNSPKRGQQLMQTPPSAPPGITPIKTSQSHLYPLTTATASQQYEQHLPNAINVISSSSLSNINAPSGDSVMKFFAAAAKPVVDGHFTPRILPNTLSVEQLEKQQRDIVATTPRSCVSSVTNTRIVAAGSTVSSPYSGKIPTSEISASASTLPRTNISGSGTKLSCAFLESVAIENSTAAMMAKNKINTKSPSRGGASSSLCSGNILQQLQEASNNLQNNNNSSNNIQTIPMKNVLLTSPSASNTLLQVAPAATATATNLKSFSNTNYNNNNGNNTGSNEMGEEMGFRKVVSNSSNLPGERISLSNIFSNLSIQQPRPPNNKPALMPPTMFDKPVSTISNDSEITSVTSINHTEAEPFAAPINHYQMQQQKQHFVLLNTKKNVQGTAETSSILSTSALSSTQQDQQPLNKCQFIQAFINLIQNDEEFVQKLHESYLKTATKFGTYQ